MPICFSTLLTSAVLQVARGDALSASEEDALAGLRKTDDEGPDALPAHGETPTFAEELLHVGSMHESSSGGELPLDELVALVLPTSNRCERLFSKAEHVLTPTRASLLPIHFEMLMFLKAN